MNIITLMVLGDLGGVQKRRPDVVHAITVETGIEAILNGRLPVAACGKKHLRFVADSEREPTRVLVWPIRANGELTRCRECWVATGKKRPRRVA